VIIRHQVIMATQAI